MAEHEFCGSTSGQVQMAAFKQPLCSIGPTYHHQPSFSFNSYQDLPTSTSTFSASNCKQLSGSTFKSNFRVHSRHRSIGKLCEVASVSNLMQSEQHPYQADGKPIGFYEIRRGNEEEEEEEDEEEVEVKKRQQEHELAEMSQTIQSIQSLSVQLNQAQSALRGSSMNELSDAAQPAIISSSGKLGRLMGKKAGRVKELLLQNLGKADKTTDELFQIYEQNFYKQQTQALKLHKEFKNYTNSLKVSHESSKSLNSCIQQSTGDYQSARHDLVCENLNQLEHLKDDLMDKLRSQILISLNEYLSQFSELREKIAKRRRKLIDYDSSRRAYEIMLASMNKKRLQLQRAVAQQQLPSCQNSSRSFKSAFSISGSTNQQPDSLQSATRKLMEEARLLKLREQYNYCKIMYETINNELYEELPLVYEKKMKHLLMTLQNYFSLEAQFHLNAGKLFATASDVIDELPMSMAIHHPHPRQLGQANKMEAADEFNKTASNSSGMGSSRGDSSLESSSSPDSSGNGSPVGIREQTAIADEEEEEVEGELDIAQAIEGEANETKAADESADIDTNFCGQETESELQGEQLESSEPEASSSSSSSSQLEPKIESEPARKNEDVSLENPDTEKVKVGNDEHVCLYKVKTIYKYLAEDVDELCFEANEIIQVVEFEESQEQEEGWLLGVREVNNQKGLFPANFTEPI